VHGEGFALIQPVLNRQRADRTNSMSVSSIARNMMTFPRCIRSLIVLLVVILGATGCTSTSRYNEFNDLARKAASAEPILLREGDVVRITFPGAPNLSATQQIRRDGKITLSLVGEVLAAGMTPADLEKQLVKLYAGEVRNKEINVTVESSSFPIFVSGAVLRPGRINSDRPITALEAIMEAGGFDYTRANLKAVRVLRNNKGRVDNIKLNLKRILEGVDTEPFYLKPSDIIYVPEKFSWF
jgi:polysaccharide export outer membrane protein